ncbi:hypothetical protein T439DRAFT_381452 [Meredithblackwellia eburnea MCA 4105]
MSLSPTLQAIIDGNVGPFIIGGFLNGSSSSIPLFPPKGANVTNPSPLPPDRTPPVFLCGITVTQVYTYFTTVPNDKPIFRWSVIVLLIIDIFHTVISCHTVYDWTVANYGNISHIARSPWTFTIEPAITGIVTSWVQLFYAVRVYLINGRHWALPSLICALSFIQLGFACGATGMIVHLSSEFSRFQSWTYGVSIWLGAAALGDVLITSSMFWALREARSQNGSEFQRTSSLIDTIIRNTIETNGLTTLFAIIDAILFGASSQAWHVIPNLCLVKLYYNSLLVSLNSRPKLAAKLIQNNIAHAGSLPEIRRLSVGSPIARPETFHARSNPAVIHVDVKVHERVDRENDGFHSGNLDLEMNKLRKQTPGIDGGW